MATTTTNFGWDIPQSTDLVKDGATAIAALGQDIDTAFIDLNGGTTGQVLAKASGTNLDFSWVAQDDSNAIQNAIVDAKGDLIGATAADTPARLAVGTNGQVLTADSTAATGIKWANVSTNAGMTLIASASFSSASSVSLATDTFTTTYDNYKLIINISNSTSGPYLQARLRAAGADNTTSNYSGQYVTFSHTGSTVSNIDGGASATSFNRVGLLGSSTPANLQIDIFNPKATAKTTFAGSFGGVTTESVINGALFNATTSFDSFSFFPTSGTITGTYSIYGYNK